MLNPTSVINTEAYPPEIPATHAKCVNGHPKVVEDAFFDSDLSLPHPIHPSGRIPHGPFSEDQQEYTRYDTDDDVTLAVADKST